MRKLKLDLEDLEVESFRTGGRERPAGTVNAHDATTVQEKEFDIPEEDSEWYCYTVYYYYETEQHTCPNTCAHSCPVCYA